MAGRHRERQYQRAAQKHNDEYLKYDYYQQIANYFERECRIAKHYDSWNYRSLDPKGEREKARKAEGLRVRRNKLRTLLKEEDEIYSKELEEQKQSKRRSKESSSLECLRQKREEQGLYLPRTCRRYQSYFIRPTESNGLHWNKPENTDLRYSRICRDSTNLIHQNVQNSDRRRSSKMSEDKDIFAHEHENTDSPQESSGSSADHGNEFLRPGSRYSARYARRSLENTNVRGDDYDTAYPLNKTPSTSSGAYGSSDKCQYPNGEQFIPGDNKENKGSGVGLHAPQSVTSDIVGQEDAARQPSKDSKHDVHDIVDACSNALLPEQQASDSMMDRKHGIEANQDTNDTQLDFDKIGIELSSYQKDIWKQMFLYLTYTELECKISDLAKREVQACNRQCWDEALRLMDMRNKLELIRGKQLYNMDSLGLNEEMRRLRLNQIEKREAELVKREKLCMDSTMYSENAKALWINWERDDRKFTVTEAIKEMEKLMDDLEKQWKSMTTYQRQRISRSYRSVMNHSALQEEYKLSAALNAAKIKSVPSSFK